jgi:hypothetical protein
MNRSTVNYLVLALWTAFVSIWIDLRFYSPPIVSTKMMKLLLLGVVAAMASEAPVITLNLGEAVSPFKHNGLTARPAKSVATTSRVHQCEANDARASKNCGMPKHRGVVTRPGEVLCGL